MQLSEKFKETDFVSLYSKCISLTCIIFCCTFIQSKLQISIALTLIHKQYSWKCLLLIFFIVNIFAFSPRENESQKKSFCCYMLMTCISKVTTITFWVTHQHSAMPENKYSLKHTSFLHDLGKLQRLHENRVCSLSHILQTLL